MEAKKNYGITALSPAGSTLTRNATVVATVLKKTGGSF
jgi:hypothetical protein